MKSAARLRIALAEALVRDDGSVPRQKDVSAVKRYL
jgi:hypothetical protein